MESTHIFAQRIKELREERGLAQGKLAEDLGISRGAVSYYEGCQRTPDITILSRFAAYFGVTADYLIGLSDNRTLENAGIGETTGLSDEAIQNIKENKDDFFYRQGLDMIARDRILCSMIAEYLYGRAAEMLPHSEYKYIPLNVSYLPEFSKITFATIIEYLPRMKWEKEVIYLDDADFIDKLLLYFLSEYAEIEGLKACESAGALRNVLLGAALADKNLLHQVFSNPTGDSGIAMETAVKTAVEASEEATQKFLRFIGSPVVDPKGGV